MKTTIMIVLAATVAGLGLDDHSLRAAETNTAPERIGVYDSRLIAYASFWAAAHQRKLNDLVKEAKAAQASGDTNRFRELDAALKQERERGHLQVFSTAPVEEILAGMKADSAQARQQAALKVGEEIRESLSESGISGTAVDPNIEGGPRWAASMQSLDARFSSRLQNFRKEISRAIEGHSSSPR